MGRARILYSSARRFAQRGFTLVELVVVIILTSIIAASATVFFRPALESYFDTRRRAELTDMADATLRRMARDVRSAVPNSVTALNSGQCLTFVPTIAGGRYRMEDDPANADSRSLVLPTAANADSEFDILALSEIQNPLSALKNQYIVIGNQVREMVYAGGNRAEIKDVQASGTGKYRLVTGSLTDAGLNGYDVGRFLVVPKARSKITYLCSGVGVNPQGTGTGVLYKVIEQLSNGGAPDCPLAVNGVIVARHISQCGFYYDPNHGATQQSGFVSMNLELKEANEAVALSYGAHVSNLP
ncbi:MAG: type II secretion system GspH family protein [Zoogloeaceae bacterium]|jgi:MSHA biogenesis protein MshO|nr:type II secretion system GspH family protein [Zoogloeaceae bacterium]